MEPQYNEIGRAGYYTNSPDNISHKNKIDLFYLAILKIVRNISLKYSNNVGWLIYHIEFNFRRHNILNISFVGI